MFGGKRIWERAGIGKIWSAWRKRGSRVRGELGFAVSS